MYLCCTLNVMYDVFLMDSNLSEYFNIAIH
jgi:hypothetical protein